mgnify:FL=1
MKNNWSSLGLAFLLSVLTTLAPVSSLAGPADEIRTLLPKDGIPSIDKPEFATVLAGDKFMKPGELIIGVDIEGDRRACSVPLLSSHEIVNDVVGGRKIAVTW